MAGLSEANAQEVKESLKAAGINFVVLRSRQLESRTLQLSWKHLGLAGNTDIKAVARGMGIPRVNTVTDLASFEEELRQMLSVWELAMLVAKVDKTVARDLPIYPFGLTENGVTFRRALINQGLVDPLHAGASWSKVHDIKL